MSSRAAKRPTPPPADKPPHAAVSNQPNAVQLGPRDRMIGQLYIEGNLRVGGIVEGEVEVTGDVEIDDQAKVKASVAGGDVNVRGQLIGSVVARKRLVVARSGSLTGDVRVARLIIQDGAAFSGKVSMGAGAGAPARASETKPMAFAPQTEVQAVAHAPAPVVPPPTAKAPVAPPPAVKARSDGKGARAKAAPPKGKPKRR